MDMYHAPMRVTFENRPEDIPIHWYIFNATRPLPGRITWTGDWLAGIYYAAMPVQDEQAIKDALELGGRLVEYMPDERAQRAIVPRLVCHAHPGLNAAKVEATVAKMDITKIQKQIQVSSKDLTWGQFGALGLFAGAL